MEDGSETSRPYHKRKRARAEQETRRRITEAAVELHGTVGPARTTVTEIARKAGVSRMTVYNHFPTEADIMVACSTHWAERNPFPVPHAWQEIESPSGRLGIALRKLYGWFDERRGMMGNVFHDAAVVPALAEIMQRMWGEYENEVVRVLSMGWPAEATAPEELEAMLRLVVSFRTWETLDEAGQGPQEAAAIASRMVVGAIRCADEARPEAERRTR